LREEGLKMANVNRRRFLRWASAGAAALAVLGRLSNEVLGDDASADSSSNATRGLNLIGVHRALRAQASRASGPAWINRPVEEVMSAN
jgi:hypothetical protein